MEPIDFSGPYLKAERAEHHIDELERIFKIYVAANKKTVIPKYNRKPRCIAIGSALSKHSPTILGDALHNLRAALDHAYIKLVEHNGKTPGKKIMWRFHPEGDRQSVLSSIKGHIDMGEGPSPAVRDHILDVIQPYREGKGERLVDLHVLDIEDKHSSLIATQTWTHIENLRFTDGSSFSGISLGTSNANAIEFGGSAGLDPQSNNKASFSVCFAHGKPLEGQPIIPALRDLKSLVDATLRSLEQKANKTT